MSSIYIVIENGVAYPTAYTHYSAAKAAVKAKHKVYLEGVIKELYYLEDIEATLADINVLENVDTGITRLYIEKGINIVIQKTNIDSNPT